MSRATPKMRDLAWRLIAYEARGNHASKTKPTTVVFVGEKLRPHLAALMGNVGFSALLARALVLAAAEVSWLRAAHVKADGSLERLDEDVQLDAEDLAEGNAILLAQLLGLLVAFIGEKLTLQLVGDVWPKLPLNDYELATGAKK